LTHQGILWVEKRVTGAEVLSIINDIGWVAMGNYVNGVVRNLKEFTRVSTACAERWELQFDTANT
jgi:hypothetical protein